jgi:hypothetical protein
LTHIKDCVSINKEKCPSLNYSRVSKSSHVAPAIDASVPFPIDDVFATSRFLKVNVKELENVENGGRNASRYGENCAKNAFAKWRKFCGFGTKRPIANVSKDANSIR